MGIQALGKNTFSKSEIKLITMMFQFLKIKLARLAPHC